MIVFLAACNKVVVKQIGKVNMISNRNVDMTIEYKLISTYSGGSKKEFKYANAISIEEAVDKTVKNVAGGEFLMNVKIFLVDKKYYAVEGDVWGKSNKRQEISFKGFKLGDRVSWKKGGKYVRGVIEGFKNDSSCLVQPDDKSKIIELLFDDLTLISE